jgi:hypothetical protein
MVGNPAHIIMYYQNWEQADKKDFDPAKMDVLRRVAGSSITSPARATKNKRKGNIEKRVK